MLKLLIDHFSDREDLPIELEEVRDFITQRGVPDQIILCAEDTDPGEVKGIFYQFSQQVAPYESEYVTLIVYSRNMSIEWQRLVCCKEIVHICEDQIEKTNTLEEVDGLLDKLLGPLSDESWGLADLQASLDKIAFYKCLPILFPSAARQQAISAIEAGTHTIEDVAQWACLPVGIVEFILGSGWPEIMSTLIEIESEKNA